jgi:phosphoserine phosphatase
MKTDLALLDMDGTILAKRSIDVLCDRCGFTSRLKEIDLELRGAPRYLVTEKIAELFAWRRRTDLESIFDSIPLNEGVHQLISFLKGRRFTVALATDGYRFLADRLKDRLQLDLVYGNMLQFEGDLLTGRMSTVPGCLKIPNCKEYLVCKLRILKSLQDALGGRTVAIGDSDSDYCMLEGADISIAYKPKVERIKEKADFVAQDFNEVITFLKRKFG